ncbi:MAG: YpmA family protein [Firmicutes bacterium]|nr:YpmA family protein [Bacillota bacterium]
MEHDETTGRGKLKLIALKSFSTHQDMYKVVDFLNKSLKDKNLMFGMTKNSDENTLTISIYET